METENSCFLWYGTRCKMGFILTQIPHIVDEVVEFKNSTMKKKYPCPHKGCKAVLSRPGRLEDHMFTHTGELPYKCSVPGCTKEYHSRNSLRRHLQESHEGKATLYTTFLRCPHPTCMMLLSNKFNLHKHYQRLHTDKFKFMCQYCDKGFRNQKQLQRHVYHHTGIPPLRCPTCSAGFVTERDLKRHQRGHRKWVCEVNDCGKIFLYWKTYRKHLSTDHSGVFQCDDCKKTFKTKNAVRLHVACHMDDNSRSVLPCPYENCERFYFHKRNLKQHVQFWHEDKGFDCKECGQTLSTNAKLKQHMLIHSAQEQPVQATKQTTTTRKKRKDAGIPHQSMAAKLSGATIPYEEEKLLLKNEYESTIGVDPVAETEVTTYSTYLAAKQRTAAKQKVKLDANDEKLQQEYTDNGDFKDVFASASPGNLQSAIMSGSDCVHAVHDEIPKISDIEHFKEDSECDPFVFVETSDMLNGKNDHILIAEKKEPCGSDDLCKLKKEALDKNVAVDALQDRDHKKEWHQVYDLKKWVLLMTGMMELLCPVGSSKSPSRVLNSL